MTWYDRKDAHTGRQWEGLGVRSHVNRVWGGFIHKNAKLALQGWEARGPLHQGRYFWFQSGAQCVKRNKNGLNRHHVRTVEMHMLKNSHSMLVVYHWNMFRAIYDFRAVSVKVLERAVLIFADQTMQVRNVTLNKRGTRFLFHYPSVPYRVASGQIALVVYVCVVERQCSLYSTTHCGSLSVPYGSGCSRHHRKSLSWSLAPQCAWLRATSWQQFFPTSFRYLILFMGPAFEEKLIIVRHG